MYSDRPSTPNRELALLDRERAAEWSRDQAARDRMIKVPARSRSLTEYCYILWRRKGILAVTILLFTAGAFIASKLQAPVYRATCSVIFQKSPEPIKLSPADPGPTQDESGFDTYFQTQIELFQSKTLVRRVLSKLGRSRGINPKGGFKPPFQQELEFLARSLKVAPTKGTRLIQIQCESHDPKLAADFANSVVSEFIQQEHEGAWNTNRSKGEWLNQEVDDLRKNIESSERNLFAYARASGLAFTSEKDSGAEERLRRLQDELSKAQVERVGAEARQEITTKTSPETVAEVIDSGSLRDYQAKITDLRRQLAEAGALWTNNHYKVKQIEAQIAVMNNALKRERNEILSRAKSDYRAALRREQLISAEYLNAVRMTSDQASKSIHYNLLKRDLERERELYDTMVQKVKQAGITSALQSTNVQVIDAAEPAIAPHRPNVPLISFLALISSTFLGIIAVLIRENTNSTLEKPGDAATYLNVNELGIIPSQRASQRRRWLPAANKDGIDSLYPNGAKAAEQVGDSVELVTWNQADSLMAQCFRATLASILYSYRAGEELRTIVVTSAGVGEGKTTAVSNLGLALARMGRKVLLIDADHRKPRLHKVFGTSGAIGLKEVLQDTTGRLPLASAVRETKIPRLYVLQSGPSTHDFPEILESERAAALIRDTKREFDFVLIDTPPVLHLPDARIWARLADGVVFVVRAGETDRERAGAAVYKLVQDGVPFLGTILNEWDPKSSSVYRYSE
ncbi:MAG: GumC family protein [Bryobacteraceae bacterium]